MIPIESIVFLSFQKFASSARLLPYASARLFTLARNKNPMLLTMKCIVIDVQMLPLAKLAKEKTTPRTIA